MGLTLRYDGKARSGFVTENMVAINWGVVRLGFLGSMVVLAKKGLEKTQMIAKAEGKFLRISPVVPRSRSIRGNAHSCHLVQIKIKRILDKNIKNRHC